MHRSQAPSGGELEIHHGAEADRDMWGHFGALTARAPQGEMASGGVANDTDSVEIEVVLGGDVERWSTALATSSSVPG